MDRHLPGGMDQIDRTDMGTDRILLLAAICILLTGCAGCRNVSGTDSGVKAKTSEDAISYVRYEKTLSDNILYVNDLAILDGTVGMQCFDILDNGDVLACGIEDGALHFQRMGRDGVYEKEMKLWFAGHGTNMSVEEDDGEVFIWTSNYASHINEGGDYFLEKLVSRVPYRPGSELLPEDCTDNYYVGPQTNILVSTDTENDLLCIIYGDNSVEGYDTKVCIWSMSAAKKAPVRTVNLGAVLRGGDKGCPVPDRETIYPDVEAHDLTKIKPLYAFRINGQELDGGDPMQGYCVYRDRFYWFAGDGRSRSAKVSVVGFDGNVEKMHIDLAFDNEKEDIVSLGSASGYFEPEGLKIRKGLLYAGFLWGHRENHRITIVEL